jgi:hypothetical protein
MLRNLLPAEAARFSTLAAEGERLWREAGPTATAQPALERHHPRRAQPLGWEPTCGAQHRLLEPRVPSSDGVLRSPSPSQLSFGAFLPVGSRNLSARGSLPQRRTHFRDMLSQAGEARLATGYTSASAARPARRLAGASRHWPYPGSGRRLTRVRSPDHP